MTERRGGHVDVEFKAKLRETREYLRIAQKAKSMKSLRELCFSVLIAKFFFLHIIIPAYHVNYKRNGRDLLELAERATAFVSKSPNSLTKHFRRHQLEIKKAIEKLEKLST